MFVPRQPISNPFLQFFGGAPFAGVPYPFPAMFHPVQSLAGIIPTQAINPVFPTQAINPVLAAHGLFQPVLGVQPSFGLTPPGFSGIGQVEAQHIAGMTPFLGNPFIGGLGFPGATGVTGVGQTAINPGISGVSGYGQAAIGPGIDPVSSYLIAQQFNPAMQQLPVRPLINPQNWNPIQSFSAGSTFPQVIDPQLALAQAQLLSSLAVNPYQQLLRNYATQPWIPAASILSGGQPFPVTQTGV
jgi:hypothetical protein